MPVFKEQLLQESRLLTVLYDNLPESIKTSSLYASVEAYLEKYVSFNSITTEKAIEFYTNYIALYNKHCRQFVKTGKYPLAAGEGYFQIGREEYDVVLLFSILFTCHRFRIMQLLANADTAGKALFIGLGSGLEIFLVKNRHTENHGYDLSVNPFLYSEFPEIQLKTELYTGQYTDYFDAIYLIELLEHLEEPYDLLATCYKSLQKNGKILLTTATDIPQFDHFYNFPLDHAEFDRTLEKMGFRIITKEKIPHHYLSMNLASANHFYQIEKI